MKEAVKIHPLLTEKEMTIRFIGILHAHYYEKIARSVTKNFINVVVLCGMIDKAMKSDSSRKDTLKDKGKEKVKAE